ncbi:aldehyde dehydrogenase family 3 member b1 [Fusarium longipes]|uniref:Aldehyde dehydrogenase family 3 member b1 n=1 Tax=Fusarium longipes TaxID=694270 RepID=A0A395SRM7_9HYPO|nr:aldehyde dehydrogenase family 3 member b1 [Fusarium longipes]
MSKQFSAIRSAAIDGRVHNPIYRKDQLRNLHSALADNASTIQDVIAKDSKHQSSEVKVEYCLALQIIADAYSSINPDQQLEEEYAVKKGCDDTTSREPVGIVVIEPSNHAFFYALIAALAPALAAGNCVIVQSENSLRETPKLVLGLIEKALDRDIFAVSTQPITPEDLNTSHTIVSQNGSTGPILRNHLVSDPKTPVVAFVERDADIASAAQALVSARFSLQGRAPYAPDVVFVNEWVKKDLLRALVQQSTEFLATSPAQGRVSKTGLAREVEKDDSTHVVLSGSNGVILDVQNRSSSLLRQKVEETTLIVHSVTSMDDAIDVSRDIGSLAAAYVFTTPSMAKYICQFLDTAVSYVNQIPTKLLYSPIAPLGSPPQPSTNIIYHEDHFSRSKPKYLTKSSTDERLAKILGTSTAAELRALEIEATKRLPEMKRRLKGTQLGFFEQGIVTSLVFVLTTLVSGTGLLGYYGIRPVVNKEFDVAAAVFDVFLG